MVLWNCWSEWIELTFLAILFIFLNHFLPFPYNFFLNRHRSFSFWKKNLKYIRVALICWGTILNLWTAFQFNYTLLLLIHFKKGFAIVDYFGLVATGNFLDTNRLPMKIISFQRITAYFNFLFQYFWLDFTSSSWWVTKR